MYEYDLGKMWAPHVVRRTEVTECTVLHASKIAWKYNFNNVYVPDLGGRGKDVARPHQVNVNVATWSRMFMKKLIEGQPVSSPTHLTPGRGGHFRYILN